MKKLTCVVLTLAVMVSMFAGCTKKEAPVVSEPVKEEQTEATETPEGAETAKPGSDKDLMKIALLKGPTAMGAAALMNESENGVVFGNYAFEVLTTPDEVATKIINGDVDVAAVPVNLASVLYNKTEGEVLIAAVNTLGNLYVMEKGSTVKTLADLSGKTVVSAGQGAVPEYVFNFLMAKANVADVTLEFVPTHADVVAALASGNADLALLPEPFATGAKEKVSGLNTAIDIASYWDDYSYEEEKVANTLPMGCIVVRKEFLETHEKDFNKFLDENDYFVEFTNENPAQAAEYIVNYGILDSKTVAEKSIPGCNMTFIEGSKMLRLVDNFLTTINEFNPKAIGGTMPEEDFYYVRN